MSVMSKRRLTQVQRFTESQEQMNAALREFNRRMTRDLPKFRARVQGFIEAVNRAAR